MTTCDSSQPPPLIKEETMESKLEVEKYLTGKLLTLVNETRLPAEMPEELIYFTVYKYEKDILNYLSPELFRAGIREVVKWIIEQDTARGYLCSKVISNKELKAKLKEWGIE